MASAEEKLKEESKDRQVMGSNANGADGAEEKMKENNISKDPKDPSGEEAELETAVSEEDVRNVEILESIADGSRKATNAEIKNIPSSLP